MELTLDQQTQIFLWSFVIGVVLFAVYIIMEVLRIVFPPGNVRVFIEDLLFMLFAAVVNFLFSLSQTYGVIRGYSLFAQTAAFALLYFTVGRIVKSFSLVIYKLFLRAYHFLSDPVYCLFNNMSKYTIHICKLLLKKIRIIKK